MPGGRSPRPARSPTSCSPRCWRGSGRLEVVRLIGRRAGVVLAELETVEPAGPRELVPCRPTDGLTLALRQAVPAPIWSTSASSAADGDVEPEAARRSGQPTRVKARSPGCFTPEARSADVELPSSETRMSRATST